MKDRPWREAVGGMWDKIGNLQFKFLVQQGLLPGHKFLDIGCGSLRGGIHFISYLDDGNYFGIDKDSALLKAGAEIEVPRAGIANRKINLHHNIDFDFAHFQVSFDYALAQSVFTHLPSKRILACLRQLKKVLAPDGKFFSTFFEVPENHPETSPCLHSPGGIQTHTHCDPFHYKSSELSELGRIAGFHAFYLGNWEHPRAQKMMLFQHSS